MPSMYTVYKCKSRESDERIGNNHYSDDGYKTLCGKTITDMWCIIDNAFTGKATCHICLSYDDYLRV